MDIVFHIAFVTLYLLILFSQVINIIFRFTVLVEPPQCYCNELIEIRNKEYNGQKEASRWPIKDVHINNYLVNWSFMILVAMPLQSSTSQLFSMIAFQAQKSQKGKKTVT